MGQQVCSYPGAAAASAAAACSDPCLPEPPGKALGERQKERKRVIKEKELKRLFIQGVKWTFKYSASIKVVQLF